MADLSDVLQTLASTIAAALYPQGGSVSPTAGNRPIKVYAGWPSDTELNTDLAATQPISHVSVYPMPNMTQNQTRYRPAWAMGITPAATLAATLNSNGTVTLSGTAQANHVVGLLTSGIGYGYRLLSTDTPATAAAAIAAAIPGATASGATITAPAGFTYAHVGIDTPATAEVGRQRDEFMISIWTPDPQSRAAISAVIRPALDGLTLNGAFSTKMLLPDGSLGDIWFKRNTDYDTGQQANAYRRDINYTIQYPTIVTQGFPQMLFGQVDLTVASGQVVTFGTLEPINNVLLDENGNIVTTGSGFLLTN